jgi:adenylosuccinate synthase
MEGWGKSTKTARSLNELPRHAKNYLNKIEELTGCKVAILSVGEKRDDTILSRSFKW